MNAKKCDRCGNFYEIYGSNTTANCVYKQNGDCISRCKCDIKYELCPECMTEFEEWISIYKGGV